jgi:hypothetical protein
MSCLEIPRACGGAWLAELKKLGIGNESDILKSDAQPEMKSRINNAGTK